MAEVSQANVLATVSGALLECRSAWDRCRNCHWQEWLRLGTKFVYDTEVHRECHLH
jgi:hypothetical protein